MRSKSEICRLSKKREVTLRWLSTPKTAMLRRLRGSRSSKGTMGTNSRRTNMSRLLRKNRKAMKMMMMRRWRMRKRVAMRACSKVSIRTLTSRRLPLPEVLTISLTAMTKRKL